MNFRKNDGFSLVDTLVAMVVLAAIVVPMCSSMILSVRINGKAEALLQEQLTVSNVAQCLQAGVSFTQAGLDLEGYQVGDSGDKTTVTGPNGVSITVMTEVLP